jgi:hypothetical protein
MTPFEVIGIVADLLGILAFAWAFLKKPFYLIRRFKKAFLYYVNIDSARLFKKNHFCIPCGTLLITPPKYA